MTDVTKKSEDGKIEESDKPHTLWLKYLLVFVATLIFMLPIASAGYVGAYNVEVHEKYIKTTAKCSCRLYTDYYRHTRVWLNYCPNCHHKGTLSFEQGHGWTSPEGLKCPPPPVFINYSKTTNIVVYSLNHAGHNQSSVRGATWISALFMGCPTTTGANG